MEEKQDLKGVLEKVAETSRQASVDAVFGKPQQIGDRYVIPVAEVSYGFGMGYQAGGASCCCCGGETPCECKEGEPCECKEGEPCECEEGEPCECEKGDEEDEARGEGCVGGGGGAMARPIAYIEVGPEGTRVEPIVDEQKLALAGILLTAWVFGWIGLILKAFARR